MKTSNFDAIAAKIVGIVFVVAIPAFSFYLFFIR